MATLQVKKFIVSAFKLNPDTLQSYIRFKHTSPYSKRKFRERITKSLLNPKYMDSPKRLQKSDIEIRSKPSQTLAAERQRQRLVTLGTEFKQDIYDILQSGRYGGELASINFAKVSIDGRKNQIHVHWQLTGEKQVDEVIQSNLSSCINDIQTEFAEIHPNARLPSIRFKVFEDNALTTETLLANLDLTEVEDDDESNFHRLPQLKFVQDVYRVNRSLILAKLHSTPSTVTLFGANEQDSPQH